MDAITGKPLSAAAHLRQSIADILSTPVGSRVGRRDYGSELPELIDQPMNAKLRLRIFAATVAALIRWEPRLSITRVGFVAASAGAAATVTVEGLDRTAPAAALSFSVPLAGATA